MRTSEGGELILEVLGGSHGDEVSKGLIETW